MADSKLMMTSQVKKLNDTMNVDQVKQINK